MGQYGSASGSSLSASVESYALDAGQRGRGARWLAQGEGSGGARRGGGGGGGAAAARRWVTWAYGIEPDSNQQS